MFILLLVLMLLTAINYQNSLIFLFTFLLSSFFFISIWLCFLNLNGLNVSSFKILDCFEGDMCAHEIELVCVDKPLIGLRLGVNKNALNEVSLNNGVKQVHHLLLPTRLRGIHQLERLRIESTFPFGFIIAWTWLKLDSKVLVFPKPVEGSRTEGAESITSSGNSRFISEDLSELKAYQNGDAASRIIWKQFAAKDQLIVRSHEQGASDSAWLNWNLYADANVEQKLQHLCFDILDYHQKRLVYGLDIPGVLIEPCNTNKHKYECLKALALYGDENRAGQYE